MYTPQQILAMVLGFILIFFKMDPWGFFGLTNNSPDGSNVKSEVDESGNLVQTILVPPDSYVKKVTDQMGNVTYSGPNGTLTQSDFDNALANTLKDKSSVIREEIIQIKSTNYTYDYNFMLVKSIKNQELTYGQVGVSLPDRDIQGKETSKL